jgi:hypothetical protein
MSDQIQEYQLNMAVVQETADRIIRDFESFGVKIFFSGRPEVAYQELMEQLTPAIEDMLSNNGAKLMHVLYRIDIAEEKLKKAMDRFTDLSFAQVISRLIIEREMQKVLTRKIYNAQQGR